MFLPQGARHDARKSPDFLREALLEFLVASPRLASPRGSGRDDSVILSEEQRFRKSSEQRASLPASELLPSAKEALAGRTQEADEPQPELAV